MRLKERIGGERWIPLKEGWSEPAATSAPVQDEAVQAVLGMNQKHIRFPCPGIFHPLLCPIISPPTYLPHLISFHAHSISKPLESCRARVTHSFKETRDIRLEEGGELNIEGMWRREGKRSASSQMQKREEKGKLRPFSAFIFSLWFFFLFLCLKKK
jgi:hypothetical protein